MAPKFQSVKLADGVDFEARQIEPDVKIQAVEDESSRARSAGEFVPGDEPFEAEAPEAAEE